MTVRISYVQLFPVIVTPREEMITSEEYKLNLEIQFRKLLEFSRSQQKNPTQPASPRETSPGRTPEPVK